VCGVSIDPTFVANMRDKLETVAAIKPVYLCLGQNWWKTIPKPVRGATYLQSIPRRGTSGFAALHLAVAKGAKRITLLGFDYTRGHYHSAYPWRAHDMANERSWPRWAEDFKIVDGIDIINASPGSLIDVYPKLTLEDALALSD
jgi:hypothetical protein